MELTAAERAGLAIFTVVISRAAGTRRPKVNETGERITDPRGNLVMESLDEAAWRRWQACPALQRQRYCDEARAACAAVGVDLG